MINYEILFMLLNTSAALLAANILYMAYVVMAR